VRIVVDAYAWVEIFRGSDEGHRALEALTNATEVHTPGTVLAEIARKYVREGSTADETMDRLSRITRASSISDVNEHIAMVSADCYFQLREKARSSGLPDPSLFDAIVLATARSLDAKVVTGDEHFTALPDTLWIK